MSKHKKDVARLVGEHDANGRQHMGMPLQTFYVEASNAKAAGKCNGLPRYGALYPKASDYAGTWGVKCREKEVHQLTGSLFEVLCWYDL